MHVYVFMMWISFFLMHRNLFIRWHQQLPASLWTPAAAGLALKMKLLLVTLLPSPLTFQPLNGDMDHLCHGLPSNQFPACYALPFSTYGQVWDSRTDRQQPSTLNASILWECGHNNNSNNTNSQIFIVPFGCSFRDAGNSFSSVKPDWTKKFKVWIQNQTELLIKTVCGSKFRQGAENWKAHLEKPVLVNDWTGRRMTDYRIQLLHSAIWQCR